MNGIEIKWKGNVLTFEYDNLLTQDELTNAMHESEIRNEDGVVFTVHENDEGMWIELGISYGDVLGYIVLTYGDFTGVVNILEAWERVNKASVEFENVHTGESVEVLHAPNDNVYITLCTEAVNNEELCFSVPCLTQWEKWSDEHDVPVHVDRVVRRALSELGVE